MEFWLKKSAWMPSMTVSKCISAAQSPAPTLLPIPCRAPPLPRDFFRMVKVVSGWQSKIIAIWLSTVKLCRDCDRMSCPLSNCLAYKLPGRRQWPGDYGDGAGYSEPGLLRRPALAARLRFSILICLVLSPDAFKSRFALSVCTFTKSMWGLGGWRMELIWWWGKTGFL